MILDIPLLYLPGISTPEDSLLIRHNFEQYVFHSNETFYGTRNKKKERNRGTYYSDSEFQKTLWKYPQRPEDLQWVRFHGRDWARYESYTDGYHGIDFYSAKHNLRTASYTLMDDIMATMKITLSDEARKHY